MTNTILKTFEHDTREANLLAAKQAVRAHRNTYLQRRTQMGADVIDIVLGRDIIERHVCKTDEPHPPVRRMRPFCVEELALYR